MKTCNHVWRIKVELFLDIPDEFFHRLSKTRLRSHKVKFDGANWEKAMAYCSKCGRCCPELGGTHP